MLHIVQFSGGLGSAAVARQLIEEHGKDSVLLVYCDTGWQDEDTFRFMDDFCDCFNTRYEYIKHNDLASEILKQNCFPSVFIPWCNRVLKTEPHQRFLQTIRCPYKQYVGMDITEHNRAIKVKERGIETPLYDRRMTPPQIRKSVEELGIRIPRTYKYFKHNNCIPCFKATEKEWFKVWKYYRIRFEHMRELEKEIGATVFKGKTLEELEKEFMNLDLQLQMTV